jgi:hypothetical protein
MAAHPGGRRIRSTSAGIGEVVKELVIINTRTTHYFDLLFRIITTAKRPGRMLRFVTLTLVN